MHYEVTYSIEKKRQVITDLMQFFPLIDNKFNQMNLRID